MINYILWIIIFIKGPKMALNRILAEICQKHYLDVDHHFHIKSCSLIIFTNYSKIS